jgi:hypothetical protein
MHDITNSMSCEARSLTRDDQGRQRSGCTGAVAQHHSRPSCRVSSMRMLCSSASLLAHLFPKTQIRTSKGSRGSLINMISQLVERAGGSARLRAWCFL